MGLLQRVLTTGLLLAAHVTLAQMGFDPDKRGSIEGMVIDTRTNRPKARVQVMLSPASGGIAPLAFTTQANGIFRFDDLPSGYYSLQAQAAGFLPSSFAQTEHTRLPFVFGLIPGEVFDGIVVRLRPAGVVSGQVQFTDGESAIGIPVEFYREYFYRGRHGFQKIGHALTDDRGFYRFYGLPPGRYYIVAAYSPPAPPAGVRELRRFDNAGRPVQDDDFVTTFYPSTPRLIEAIPIRLRHGEEMEHTDILLTKALTSRVRGRITSGLSGAIITSSANIRLRQPSPVAEVMVDAPVSVNPKENGDFEIVGITPGSYTLIATASENGVRLNGRIPISVSGADVDNIEVTLSPFEELTGKVTTEEDVDVPLSMFRVSLEPHSDSVAASASGVEDDGSFSIPFVLGETYDVFLLDGPPTAYLKSARTGGFDVLSTGFMADSGRLPPMTLEFSTRGAVIRGEIADTSTKVALGATVVLVPEPARGKMQHYQMTTTDAYGLYRFTGVAPGRYTVASWWDEPPCEVYDLESLEACREIGKSVEVEEGEDEFLNMPLAR
jgi:carboxypeptidase family protein